MGSRLCPLPTAAAPPCSGQRSSLGADELQASRRVCCHHSIRMQCHTLHASTTLQLLSIDIDIDRRPMLGNLNYSPLFRVPDLLIPGRRQHLSTQVIMPMMPTTRKDAATHLSLLFGRRGDVDRISLLPSMVHGIGTIASELASPEAPRLVPLRRPEYPGHQVQRQMTNR